jgi:two-component system chemotaxis response regulator CheB
MAAMTEKSPDETISATIPYDLVVIAASTGGLEALKVILNALPADFPAAIAVVQHRDPRPSSRFEELVGRRTRLAIKQAEAGDVLSPGTVHVAPPGRHLVVGPGGTLSLSDSAKVRSSRPSADPLFESAAAVFGARVIVVVLTGADGDGSDGVRVVKRMGGRVIAQDEESSQVYGMPYAALKTGMVDYVLPLGDIAARLLAMV